MSSGTGITGILSKIWKKIVDHFEDYEIKRDLWYWDGSGSVSQTPVGRGGTAVSSD